MLDQLASGATDLAACRKLGVSRRTYSRRVSEPLEHGSSGPPSLDV
ncbi:helix-turn-helix domain-containing protein [Micromonospora sp. NPDC049044]